MKEELQKLLSISLEATFNIKMPPSDIHIERPADEAHGDWASNIALSLSKRLKLSPMNIVEKLLSTLNNYKKIQIGKSKGAKKDELNNGNSKIINLVLKFEGKSPGFINIFLTQDYYLMNLKKVSEEKKDYGRAEWGKNKAWLVEHTSPNPNKAMHLGHLRNNLTGMSIANLFEFIGIKVVRDCVDNNRGIAIARLMWGYLKFARKDKKHITDIDYWYEHQQEWLTPGEAGQRPDKFMDNLYVLASADFNESSEVEEKVRRMVMDWEAEDKKIWALWDKVLLYVYQGQQLTLKRLGNKWDKIWHEHDHYKKGKEYVVEGLKKGIFRQLENGAVLTNLKDFGISDTIIKKADGTGLYITQDIALTGLKKKKFKPNKLFWVIGPEQSLALKQVFAVCEQLGIGKTDDFVHVSYGWMSIKGQGRMSSRLGNVIYIDDLLDISKEQIMDKFQDSEFSEEEKENIAERVGVGAVKYSILKVGRNTDISFDIEASVSFEGDSGPYLMYTYVRAKSIMRQISNIDTFDFEKFLEVSKIDVELSLIKWIERFPESVFHAAINYAPNHLAAYLYELAQRFNKFYGEISVLNATSESERDFRLAVTSATAQVIKNGLKLLGINTVEKM